MDFKLMLSFVFVFTFLTFIQCSELDDEIDKQLSDPTEPESSHPRYFADVGYFFNNIDAISYKSNILNQDIDSLYLTFPSKAISSINLNLTTPSAKAVFGNLALIGLGAYLLSFIPIGESTRHRNRNDDFDPDLGFGLNRDTEIFFDEFGNEIDDYDYQYPDSIDFGSFSSFSSASEPKISTRKTNGDLVNRKGDGRSINTKKTAKSIGRSGVLEDLSNKFWSLFGSASVKRAGNSEGFGIERFLASSVQRYEDYWKRRRSGILKKSSNVEENTFRNKNRISAVKHYLKPNAPIPFEKEEPYHYPSHDTPGSYHSGPSWPGQDTENQGGVGESDISEVYGNHFGVDGSNGDGPVEYVYSQK